MSDQEISRTRKVMPFVVLGVAVLAAAGYTIDEKTTPSIHWGPMVHMPGPTSLALTWKADSFDNKATITFQTEDGEPKIREVSSADGRYKVQFDDLEPGATYIYSVTHASLLSGDAATSGPHKVQAQQPRGNPFRFLAFGDSGNGSNTQAGLSQLMASRHPDVVIHVGDLVYPDGATKDFPAHFYHPNRELIASVPFMACLGNHDVHSDTGKPFLAEFLLPENGPEGVPAERNFYFDYGDARFVALDSNLATERGAISHADMKTKVATWLRSVLTDCDARWKFVYFHHPFYTGSAHQADGAAFAKEAFVKVIEDCGVDIVFNGHNHLYERTAPILNDQIVGPDRGVIYIVTGAGGVNRYPESDNPPPYIKAFNDKVFSFTEVEVTHDTLTLNQIDEYGEPIDTLILKK